MTSLIGMVILTMALSGPALAFLPKGHVTISRKVLLQKVKDTCRAVAQDNNYEFRSTGDSPEEIVQACLGPTATGEVSGAKFHAALKEIDNQNGFVDRFLANSPQHHFHSEAFLEGRKLITEGLTAIKANIREENFKAARETLGRILHTLQDFYSHSNWVELGYKYPYLNLIRQDLPIDNIADKNTPTCRDCTTGDCSNPILPSVLENQKLTSGYIGIFPPSTKPTGKCSHGGEYDLTSDIRPRGGIHKDERRRDNAFNYDEAVKVANAATLELLEDIHNAVGDKDFLRMMGIDRSAVVCFVIDTTGSMSGEIAEVKRKTHEIIDKRKGTQDEPSEYILVPFNDPEFGPVFKTADPEVMKNEISKIKVDGGGDHPEMCYSGIQLALTTAPAYSTIYVFTDASAKDVELEDTLFALIDQTRSEVSFFKTKSSRRRRSTSRGTFESYKKLALASGGQAIEVSKSQLPQATDIILDTSTSALVTVLQQARNPGKPEIFSFDLDASLKNTIIYITGTAVTFTLTNSNGATQSSSQTSGDLATISAVGNLWRTSLNDDRATGTWQININSNNAYTLKVTGQSTISFIYDFVEKFGGPHPGYAVITGRPRAGQPATLMVPVMGREGPNSLQVKEISLISVSNSSSVTMTTISETEDDSILVTVPSVPEGEFVILLKGTDKVSNTDFQRQSTTQMSVSKVNIQATVSSSLEPGKPFTLPFSVLTNGAGGDYTIGARNDRGFTMNVPTSLTLTSGVYYNATLTITPPANTVSGTDATLTLEASRGADSNYVVLRLSVLEKITDFYPPLCEITNIVDNCSHVSQCKDYVWEVSMNLTDGNGTGIESVTLRRGNGTLTKVTDSDPAQYYYNASCCAELFELVAVDKIGNVGKCFHSIVRSASTPAPKLSVLLMLSLLFALLIVRPS